MAVFSPLFNLTHYWQQAGQRAIERSANAEAISHFDKGLELLKTLPDSDERLQNELDLQVALGPALMATQGFGAPDVGRVYTRARQLCQQVEESPQLFPVLAGLRRYYGMRGEFQTAHELSEVLFALAQQTQDRDHLLEAHYSLGFTLYMLGSFVPAYEHLAQGLTLYDVQQHRSLAFTYGFDLGVYGLVSTAFVLWFLGYPDQALTKSHEALRLAHELMHPLSLARALGGVTELHLYRREVQAAQERAEAKIAFCTEHGFPMMGAFGMVKRGQALVLQGQEDEGITQIRQGLDAWLATGATLAVQGSVVILAAAYRSAGRIEEGLTALAEARMMVNKNEENCFESEIHHLKGGLLLQQSSDNHTEAETSFQQAIAIAQSQQAKSLELRAATSLARLWQSQDKCQEAYDLLAPVYNWFQEGFDTADLKDAKALLDELS
jgi:predicted ATPase